MNPVKWLVTIVLLFFLSRLSISVDTVTPDHFIKDDGEVIVSSGKAFAMGFFSPGNSKNRYVGIWYHQVPEKTVVWMANRENPINDTSGILSIDSRGNLALFQRNQTLPVWATNISIRGTRNCIAQLLDSGNLVLLQNGAILWQSFDYPTNTWLPSMKLGLSLKTGLNRFLTSWKSPDDPRIGTYSIRIDPRGFPQMFLYKGSAPWWRTGSWTGRRWSGVPEMYTLIRNYIFNVSFVNNDDEVLIIDRLTNASILTRAIIHETGIFERSTWNNQAHHWFGFFSAPKEQCDFYGHCGPNGYCDPSNDFECTCFPGFEPKSPQGWNLRDGTGGCVRKRGGSRCQNGEGFMKVARTKVPDTSETIAEMSLGLKQCREKCLRNCSCVAYASAYFESERKGGIGCLTWHGDLVDARAYPDSGQDLYIRVDADELARHTKKGVLQKKGVLAVLIVLAVIMFLVVVIFLHWLVRRQRKARKRRQSKNVFGSSLLKESVAGKEIDEDRGIADLPFFDISTMATATNNFSPDNKLGQGGFGSVYKGVLFNGKEIAVKRLSKHSGQGVEEFKNEILLIAKLQHRNLVRILGCCIEGEEKMLIYEYLPNKSLDSFIFDESKRSLLGWKKRLEIICGVARGILYLHQDSRLRIIHRDLKASNVLLDAAMNPKISDFGMARMFGGDEIEGKTKRVVGTYGYMSPEYAMEGHFSMKSDVYSFGVLMLEIITGRKNSSCYPDSPSLNLVGHVWDLWKADKVLEVVDSTLGDSYPTDEFLKCTQIGLLCVQEHATDRPMMSTIVFMLGNETALPSPKQPAFIRKKVHQDNEISGEGTCSANDVTVTMIQAR